MPTAKPTKPSVTLPSAFGTSVSNVKTAFTDQELIDGYSASIPQVLDGGNVNWLNDTMFKYLTYTTAICDWLNGLGTSKVPFINSSNQLDSATPVLAGENNTFTGSNKFSQKVIYTSPHSYTTPPSSVKYDAAFAILDNDSDQVGCIEAQFNTDGSISTNLIARMDIGGEAKISAFRLGLNSSGVPTINASNEVKSGIASWSTTSINKASNGYVKFANGIIIQWGTTSSSQGSTQRTVNLPTAFSNTNYGVSVQGYTGGSTNLSANSFFVSSKSTTNFICKANANENLAATWVAIGY